MSGPSHIGEDWHGQWQRIQRWYDRINPRRHNLPDDYMVEAKALLLDDVFAFFMNCYHLRDWLIESGAKARSEVDDYIAGNDALALAKDICNGMKHCRLQLVPPRGRRPPANPHWTTTADEMTPMPPEPARWHFVTDGGRVDMFWTADQCMTAWREFLARDLND